MTGRPSGCTSTASRRALAGPAAITTNSLAVGLGAQSDNTRRFTGLLDDARIYGSALSASQIAALAGVGGPNTAPVAVADSYSTPLNTALVQAAPGVLANDTDANSDPLTAVLNANVTHGTLALNANGGFTYTPTTGYSGPDSFTYHANDGTANSNIVTVSLTVNACGGNAAARRACGVGLDVRQTPVEAVAARWGVVDGRSENHASTCRDMDLEARRPRLEPCHPAVGCDRYPCGRPGDRQRHAHPPVRVVAAALFGAVQHVHGHVRAMGKSPDGDLDHVDRE